jgi:hypothetical protein
MPYSRIWRRVFYYICNNISAEPAVYIFRVNTVNMKAEGSCEMLFTREYVRLNNVVIQVEDL